MGSEMSRHTTRWLTRNDRRLLLLGLDGAGKTTILHQLKLGQEVVTVPTSGFNVETIRFQKLELSIWDVGGQDTLRPLWRHHFTGTQGIIFVVDSSDTQRLELARRELHGILSDSQLQNASLLVLMNKQDLENASSVDSLVEELDFKQYCQSRAYHVESTVATTGVGLTEGLQWLCENMEGF